jgi:hypothetical protein
MPLILTCRLVRRGYGQVNINNQIKYSARMIEKSDLQPEIKLKLLHCIGELLTVNLDKDGQKRVISLVHQRI